MRKLVLLLPVLVHAATPCTDCRTDFEANAYAGVAIDSFAAPELNSYLNPDASGLIRQRAIAGFDFEYRVLGDSANPGMNQFWLYGKTEHGVRSADVDCSLAANSTLAVCGNLSALQPATKFIYMLQNATSLEAFTGMRWEFPAIRRMGGSSARPYINVQFGFLSVAGSGSGAILMNHVGLGLVVTNGRFLHSHLEAGFGRTGLYVRDPNRRLIVDGYLEWQSTVFNAIKARPFVQMTVDSGLGSGADSVTTYLGLKFDLDKIF
jgi:hypothetical protein